MKMVDKYMQAVITAERVNNDFFLGFTASVRGVRVRVLTCVCACVRVCSRVCVRACRSRIALCASWC